MYLTRLVIIGLSVFTMAFTMPWSYTKIGEILSHPDKLEGKKVTIKGVVTSVNKLPLVSTKFYKLKDSSGEITVATKGDLPSLDEKVSVTGNVSNTVIVLGTTLGVHIEEIKR